MPDQRDSVTTIGRRPLPKRLPNGLLAWEATVGYINTHTSPDALLKLQAYARDEQILWSAQVSWSTQQERVADRPSLAEALRDLWQEVDHHHVIYPSEIEAVKSPRGYADDQWVDANTQKILDRLVTTTQNVYPGDWTLIVVYRPVDDPAMRVQARLLVQDNSQYTGARGATLHDACHAVFRSAARLYARKPQGE